MTYINSKCTDSALPATFCITQIKNVLKRTSALATTYTGAFGFTGRGFEISTSSIGA